MTLQNAFEDLSTAAKQDTGNTTLASILTGLNALSTAARQDAIITALGTLLTELAQKLEPADLAALATAAKQDTAAGKLDTLHTDLGALATQTTAAAILAKLSADPATQTTLEAVRVLLAGTLTVGLPTGAATSAKQDTQSTKLDTLHTDLAAVATQTTLAAVLAKLSADPATQTTLASVLSALQGTLTVGLPSGAATAAKQDTQATKLDTLHTDLGLLATAAAQTTAAGKLDTLHTDLGTLNAKDFSTETTLAALSAKYPAVAALADAIANPSLSRVASFLHGYNGTTWDRLRSDTANGLDTDPTRMPPDATATGSLSGTGSVALALASLGARPVVAFDYIGTYTGVTVVHEVSFDGGTTYQAMPVVRSDTVGNTPTSSVAIAGTNMWFLGFVPAGATHVRSRVSAISTGTVAITVAAGVGSISPFMSVAGGNISATLQGTTVQVGFVQAAGIWNDETSTPLTGAGTFTGGSRDLHATASNATVATASARGHVEFRASAIADVAGTLYLEVSADGTTWYRVKQVALAAAPTLFYGEIVHRPSARFARAVFVNGAGAQATFRVFTGQIGD